MDPWNNHLLPFSELASESQKKMRSRLRGKSSGSLLANQFGGKGARLVWLVQHGFQVPPGVVIASTVFESIAREVLPPGHDVKTLLRLARSREGADRAGRAHERMLKASLPAWLRAELARVAKEYVDAPWGLAIRSSATCEDGTATSLAGLASTRLGVRSEEALCDAVREVWASLLLPRALTYLAERGVPSASMAVVIQVVVAAEASGVATVERLTTEQKNLQKKDTSSKLVPSELELHVNATWGLGAPLVGGVTSPDVFRVRSLQEKTDCPPKLEILEQTIAKKTRSLVVGKERTEIESVANHQVHQPALSQQQLLELASIAHRLESIEPGAWELEIALQNERLWLLQARPVVEAPLPEGGQVDTVWSCANLAEALPGVATPLTWSVAAQFSELGFRYAFQTLGCTVRKGVKFVSNVYGRFYLNLTAFAGVAASVPGLDPSTLLELGGGDGALELTKQVEHVSHRGFLARLPFTALRFVHEQLTLDRELEVYEREASTLKTAFESQDLGILTDEGVATTLRKLQKFLDRTGVLMLVCASNSLGSFVALKHLIALHDKEHATQVAEALTSGGALKGWGELESARPTTALVRIAEIALHDDVARERLLDSPPPTSLDALPKGPTRDALERWVVAYGDRAVREAELSTPRWKEDMSFPLATLAIYIRQMQAGVQVSPALREVSERAAEEAERLEKQVNIVERTVLRHLVARCQRFARLRERMRAWVTWVLGAIRIAALEGGRRLVRRGTALVAEDVFFCAIDELFAALRGEPTSIARIIAARRAEYARDLARPDPPTTFVGRPSPVRLEALGGPQLKGHGASAGIVRGPVRILASPNDAADLRAGDILVTRTTDVGWTPLFLCAAGVVTELGGPLSHAAIVARELGVPCVVNAFGATQRLKNGDIVTLDGSSGIVALVSGDAVGVKS